ncbi:MAG TPA: lipoprotein [Lysobacter sp.]
MTSRLAAVVLLSLGLAACGNKGPLVLPTAPSPDQVPPAESPPSAEPTPEALNDQQQAPPEGDGAETVEATTPPSATPPPTP